MSTCITTKIDCVKQVAQSFCYELSSVAFLHNNTM